MNCDHTVYIPEQYRRTGRGPTGFEMHYTEKTCSRAALEGKTKCWQHDPERGAAAADKAWNTRIETRARKRRMRLARGY
jgi:hypothetical protein